MRVFLILVAGTLLSACAAQAPYSPAPPPPGFPGSQPLPEGARYCGGMVAGPQQSCGAGEFCRRTVGDYCGAADAPGICSPKPQMCTMDYNPVCGCDGITYPNECAANAKGVSAANYGVCK